MGFEDTIKALQMEQKNAHFLVVDGFSKLLKHKVEICPSSIFNVFGLKWKFYINPSGEYCEKDYLSFYLKLKDRESLGSNWKVTCSFELSVLSQTRPNKKESNKWDDICYDEEDPYHGEECFMTHKQLNNVKKGYIVNDKVVFCAEITDVKPKFYMTVPQTMGTAERLKIIDIPRENSRFTWKITKFSSFTNKRQESYEFTVGPRRWRLVMFPNGTGDGEGKSLSVFLKACDYVTDGPKTKTLTVFKLRVLDQLHRNHIEVVQDSCWFSYYPVGKNSTWGDEELVPLKELQRASRGLLVDDQIYIGVEFIILSINEDL